MRGALYGVLLLVMFEVFTKRLPQPTGSIIMFGLFTAQFIWLSMISWRRMGLPYATASMAIVAAIFAGLTVLAATGQGYPNLPFGFLVAGALALGSCFVFFWLESKKNPRKWQAWRDHQKRTTFWDTLRGRHIPQLRDGPV
jgi:hypothetical protein